MASAEVCSLLDRIRQQNEAQERHIRYLRESLNTKTFSITSMRVQAATAAPSLFVIYVKRNWNQEFQSLCSAILPLAEKLSSINNFLAEFKAEMESMSQHFIDQYLGEIDNQLDFEGSQGGTSTITISLLDGDSRHRYSCLAKEQAAQYRFLAQQFLAMHQPLVSVVPRIVTTYKGRFMVIGPEPTQMGETLKAKHCLELQIAFSSITQSLNFTPYYTAADAHEQLVCGPSGATAYRGHDGRIYCNDIKCLYPYFPPARGKPIDPNTHKVHLRHELVDSDDVERLSPGAFVVFGAQDSAENNINVRDAAAYMCQSMVKKLAKEFQFRVPSNPDELIEKVHKNGINVSCLGLISRYMTRGTSAFRAVWAEMVARVLRDIIIVDMSQRIETSEIKEAVGEVLAQLFNPDTRNEYYFEAIAPRLRTKFMGLATFFPESEFPGADEIDDSLLLSRTAALTGVVYGFGVSPEAREPSHFAVSDLVSVTKKLTVPIPHCENRPFLHDNKRQSVIATPMRDLLHVRCALMTSTFNAANVEKYIADRNRYHSESGSKWAHHAKFTFLYSAYDVACLLNRLGRMPERAVAFCDQAIRTLVSITERAPSVTLLGMIHAERAAALKASENISPDEVFTEYATALKLLVPNVPVPAAVPIAPTGESITSDDESNSTMNSPREAGLSTGNPPEHHFSPLQTPMNMLTSLVGASTAAEYVTMCESRGLIREAAAANQLILQTARSVHGDKSPQTLQALRAVTRNALELGDYEMAAITAKEMMENAEYAADPNGATAVGSVLYASALAQQGKLDECPALFEKGLKALVLQLGHFHSDVADARRLYGACLIRLGQFDNADSELKLAVDVLRKQHGSSPHEMVAGGLADIGLLRLKQGNMMEAKTYLDNACNMIETLYSKTTLKLLPILRLQKQLAETTGDKSGLKTINEKIAEIERINSLTV